MSTYVVYVRAEAHVRLEIEADNEFHAAELALEDVDLHYDPEWNIDYCEELD
jgi:hypothetical protein